MTNELTEKILICTMGNFEIYFTPIVDDAFDFDYMEPKDSKLIQEQLTNDELVLFCARVTVEYEGNVYGDDYLGGCLYNNYAEFYTKYKDEYLKQMIDTALYTAKQNAEGIIKTFATQPNQVNNNE